LKLRPALSFREGLIPLTEFQTPFHGSAVKR
jgi:hypothetical protein